MTRFPRLMILAVFVVSLAVVASSAMAQPGGGRGGPGGEGQGRRGPGGGGPGGMMGRGGPGGMMRGGGGVMGLLRSDVIRTELGINEATTEEVRNAAREVFEADGGFRGFEGMRDLSEEDRRKKMEEFRAKMQERGKAVEKKIAEVIGMEKFGRLKEIELQMAGVQGVSRPDVANFLELTEEQKEKLRGLMEGQRNTMREKMGEVFSGGFRDLSEEERRAAMEKMGTVRKEVQKELETNVMGLLTDEQKEKLGEMMGEPFAKMDEVREQLSRGFGGRGAPGRGGPRGEGRRGDRGGQGRGEGRRQRPT